MNCKMNFQIAGNTKITEINEAKNNVLWLFDDGL
jgi:hypothetical protein